MIDRLSTTPFATERRTQPRFPCTVRVLCHPNDGWEWSADPAAQLHDVSTGGIGLLLDRPLVNDIRLSVLVTGYHGHGTHRLEVRVVRIDSLFDGHWLHGCVPAEGHDHPEFLKAFLDRQASQPTHRPSVETVPLGGELEDCYTLFMRPEPGPPEQQARAERPLATYASYEEAHRAQRELRRSHCDSVVRFVGPAGGGD